MMSNFPLYDTLIKEVSDQDLSTEQKDEFISKVKKIDHSGAELIYAIIRTYQMDKCDDRSFFKLPFEGKYQKNDIKFNLETMPFPLKQMLYTFISKHSLKMKEEHVIEEKRITVENTIKQSS